MAVYIYNSLTRKKEELIPINPPLVGIYVCGPTVYDEPHIGHLRSAYIFDVIKRYLKYRGLKVKFARNVTDVDDKIIDRARTEYQDEDLNTSFKKVAKKYLDSYHQALEALEIDDKDTIEPKASDYIAKMIPFIQGLINRGIAYQAGGDVYFDITKAKNYGKLSGQSLEKMEAGARVSPTENKRNPLDFALWKSAKENEPFWESNYGRGRPGWHLECSVMSSDILGDEFDLHGGGLDLIFPHHENEIAQSEGAGKKFARYWLHHGLLTINGQKMSKSLGNFITIKEVLRVYPADVLKIFYLQAHYSSPVDFSEEKMTEAKQALERIIILMNKEVTKSQSHKVTSKEYKEIEEIKNKFIAAMDDDFNMPQGLAAIFELVNAANKNIDDKEFILQSKKTLEELLNIFGISLKGWDKKASGISEEEVKAKIKERNNARQEKDYALSDKIRKELEAKGIILEDTKEGTTWRRKL